MGDPDRIRAEPVGSLLRPGFLLRARRQRAEGRLTPEELKAAEELVYLRGRTDRRAKVALPSPALFANFWTPRDPPDAYPDLGDFLEDVARVLEAEARELARLGARYLQLDAPHYPLLLDPETAAWYAALGWDRGTWLERSVELENRVMAAGTEAAPDLTWSLHMCRGNQDSRWLAKGDYAPLAETVFGATRADRLLLEYDDARAGGFEPLGAVPDGKVVVLGLVTTKRPVREDPDELVERVREAARHLPVERLAVSPQCGFASSVVGNRIDVEDQAWKLAAVAETARRVWGPGVAA